MPGACAVMALERVPSDIRAAGGVARMSDPVMIEGIMKAVSIPVMAKARIGHFVEAQVLEALGVDYIDESEVLTPADEINHIDKHAFKVPFVCGCRNLGEALRRINEGAAMIRTKGEAGTGDIVEAVRHIRTLMSDIRRLQSMREDELFVAAKEMDAPYDLVKQVHDEGRLPVVNFVAGGIAIPADAALAMQLGRRGRLRGLGHLQEREPGQDGRGDRPGHAPLRQPQDHRRGLQGSGQPRCAASPRPGSPRRIGWRSGAGDRPTDAARSGTHRLAIGGARRHPERVMKIGVLALHGADIEHMQTLRVDRRRAGRGPAARGSRRPRRPDPARRREHDDAQARRPLGSARAGHGAGPLRARPSWARAPA